MAQILKGKIMGHIEKFAIDRSVSPGLKSTEKKSKTAKENIMMSGEGGKNKAEVDNSRILQVFSYNKISIFYEIIETLWKWEEGNAAIETWIEGAQAEQ